MMEVVPGRYDFPIFDELTAEEKMFVHLDIPTYALIQHDLTFALVTAGDLASVPSQTCARRRPLPTAFAAVC